MVKGTQPFSNGEIENVKEQVLHKDINYSGFKNNALKELCESLLERDPENRYSAFQAINQLKLIKTDIQKIEDTVPTNFKPDIHRIMFILYNDRTIIEELKNIFLSECTQDELYKMFEEIISTNKNKKLTAEINNDMVSEKLYMKAEKLIEFAQNCEFSPENLKIRLKKYCDQKVIDKIKKQMINVDNFFITLIESLKFIRKIRCLNDFKKMDKSNMGWLSVKQINNYFIDPIKKHNIKTKLNPNERIEFEKFYKLTNEYNGIKDFYISSKNL
jgi:serine/threonine protein kinase